MPEVNFQDQDALIERMNEINQKKIEYEGKLKKIEKEKKILENDLKKKKKEYHRVIQRTMNTRKKGKSVAGEDSSEDDELMLTCVFSQVPTFHLVT